MRIEIDYTVPPINAVAPCRNARGNCFAARGRALRADLCLNNMKKNKKNLKNFQKTLDNNPEMCYNISAKEMEVDEL